MDMCQYVRHGTGPGGAVVGCAAGLDPVQEQNAGTQEHEVAGCGVMGGDIGVTEAGCSSGRSQITVVGCIIRGTQAGGVGRCIVGAVWVHRGRYEGKVWVHGAWGSSYQDTEVGMHGVGAQMQACMGSWVSGAGVGQEGCGC